MSDALLHGLVVEFEKPEDVLQATRRAWEAGYREMDAYTPYPVEGLAAALGMRQTRLPSMVFIGGLVGAGVGFLMQYYTMAIDYPLNVGGRPLNSWPAFIVIAFELLVLVAALSAFLGMLLLNGLPRPNHPIFNAQGFARASQDRFFLCIEASDPRFDVRETRRFLATVASTGEVIEVFDDHTVPPGKELVAPSQPAPSQREPDSRVPLAQAQER